jgi:hypothetical protein
LGFQSVGYISTVPLAVLLVLLAGMPAIDDLRARMRQSERTR